VAVVGLKIFTPRGLEVLLHGTARDSYQQETDQKVSKCIYKVQLSKKSECAEKVANRR